MREDEFQLKKLLRYHQRPPTWRRLLPSMLPWICAYILIAAIVIILDGKIGSLIRPYYLGFLVGAFVTNSKQVAKFLRWWPLQDAIIDWDRVEEILRREAAGHGPPTISSGDDAR